MRNLPDNKDPEGCWQSAWNARERRLQRRRRQTAHLSSISTDALSAAHPDVQTVRLVNELKSVIFISFKLRFDSFIGPGWNQNINIPPEVMLLILVKSAAHLSRCYCTHKQTTVPDRAVLFWLNDDIFCISKGRHMEEKTAVFSLTGKCGCSILVFSSEALWSTQSLILPLCIPLCTNLLLAVQARLCRVHLRSYHLRKWSWHRREKAKNQCWMTVTFRSPGANADSTHCLASGTMLETKLCTKRTAAWLYCKICLCYKTVHSPDLSAIKNNWLWKKKQIEKKRV